MAKALATHDRGAGRHPLKQREIAAAFAADIRSGQLAPGDRLPVREELKERFATTSTTIQRAIDQLIEEGILTSLPRQGTFIADAPPCLDHIAVGFPWRRGKSGWRGLDETIWQLCHDRTVAPAGHRLLVYDGLEDEGADSLRQQLADDMLLGRVGGLILTSSPHVLIGTPIYKIGPFPRIAIQLRDNPHPTATLGIESDGSLDHGFAALRARGCARLGVLSNTYLNGTDHEQYRRAAHQHGFATEAHWFQAVSIRDPAWAANLTHLLLSLPAARRPDAIYVQDDTLLPHCIEGVNRSGLRVGREVQILAQCNFPAGLPPDPAILRMGKDIAAGMQLAVDHLRGQRLGKRQPRYVEIPLRYEWEEAT